MPASQKTAPFPTINPTDVQAGLDMARKLLERREWDEALQGKACLVLLRF